MSEKQKLRDQVAALAEAVDKLTEQLAKGCCNQHVCWHYYQYPTMGAAQVYYPYTVTYGSSSGITYSGGSSGSIGMG